MAEVGCIYKRFLEGKCMQSDVICAEGGAHQSACSVSRWRIRRRDAKVRDSFPEVMYFVNKTLRACALVSKLCFPEMSWDSDESRRTLKTVQKFCIRMRDPRHSMRSNLPTDIFYPLLRLRAIPMDSTKALLLQFQFFDLLVYRHTQWVYTPRWSTISPKATPPIVSSPKLMLLQRVTFNFRMCPDHSTT